MKEQTLHLHIEKKIHYFSHLFTRGIMPMYKYSTMTSLFFDTKQLPTNIYHTDIKNTQNNTLKNVKNIYNQNHVSMLNIYPNLHASFPESTSNISTLEKHSVLNQYDVFSQHIATKFVNFKSPSHIDTKHFDTAHTIAQTHMPNRHLNHAKQEPQNAKRINFIHPQDKVSTQTEYFKNLEERIVVKVEERLNSLKETTSITELSHEKRILVEHEHKKTADKIYTMVTKRWDKELRRKGHLYG